MCFGIDWISSFVPTKNTNPTLTIPIFQVMPRHLGIGFGIAPLHHPPSPEPVRVGGCPRPDLRGPSGGVWSPLEALRGRARPADTSRHPKSSQEALRSRPGPPDTSRHLQTPNSSLEASGVAQGRAEARRGRQGPGRRSKGPGALSTPRGRDLDSPCVLG